MTYTEAMQAAAELEKAQNAKPARKQRGATKAQLEHRARLFGVCPDCGMRKAICAEVGGCQP